MPRLIRGSDVHRCPILSLDPSHYHEDGTCLCVDPDPPFTAQDDQPEVTEPPC